MSQSVAAQLVHYLCTDLKENYSMRRSKFISGFLISVFMLSSVALVYAAQGSTTLRGKVILGDNGTPVHNVTVTILQLRRTAETDDNGVYEFQNIPAGNYDVSAHLDRVPDVVQSVKLNAGATETLDFQLRLTGVKEQITVTASGNEESSFNSFQSITSLGSIELAQKNTASLGEVLDHQPGIAKRSFGPGNARPVVRGFDGDRVLVLQDGERIGSLGFQSGDHGEPLNVLTLEKLEVVKGPATLLYGSNAIGGVVNAITGHESAHKGAHGYLTGILGSNREQFGGSGGVEFGTEHWLFWGNGGAQRSDDYKAGKDSLVLNSFTRSADGSTGFGYYKDKRFFSVNYGYNKNRYGIPVNTADENPEVVFLDPRKQNIKFNGGFRDLDSFVNSAKFTLQYTDYKHDEVNVDTGEIGTGFKNKTLVYDGMFDERRVGRYSGTFGFWGLHRDYKSIGEEAIAPPTKQNSFAVFALQKVDFERLQLQFGGRLERTAYNPGMLNDVSFNERAFTGFSGAAGARFQTWKGGALVANYTHNYRAPALEELYNNGPHPGNLTFEIGDENLKRESGDGIELGIRHSSNRVRGEFNFFSYRIRDFIYLAPTGEIDEEEGLVIANYSQAKSRFTGTETQLDFGLHPNIWLLTGLDYVNAKLIDTDTPLPRIPPLRGRLGLEMRYKGFTVTPEAIMAKDQNRIFPTETRTPGYTAFNLNASYTFTSQHLAHVFAVNGFNLGDRLYFNHLSFIKNIAPEIGRGVRVTYTMRFF
jgi:iron complex outermembrane receptor protein